MSEAANPFRWVDLAYNQYAYVNTDNRVLGEVRDGFRVHTAVATTTPGPVRQLGDYTDRESAKRAVERAVAAHADVDGP